MPNGRYGTLKVICLYFIGVVVFYLLQVWSQPIAVPAYIQVLVPYTCGSTLHDGTIEARHG